MIAADISEAQLEQAIAALRDVEPGTIEPEFRKASMTTVVALEKDLRGGVAVRTGDLRDAIEGEVKQVVGADVEMRLAGEAQHGGYGYGGRLDKDGGMTWRSGRFSGRKTFGWFSYFLQTKGRTIVRRNFRKAVEVIVDKLARKMETGA